LAAAVTADIRSAFGDDDTPNPPSDQEWRITATLERPGKIGYDGSLFCAASKRSWRKNVRLEETSYRGITYDSRPSGNVENRRWVPLQDSSGVGFPRDLDARETTGFVMTIRENPDGATYLLQLNFGGRWAPLSKEFIEAHEKEIVGLAQTIIVPVTRLVPHLALVPTQVFKAVPQLLVSTIKTIIAQRLDKQDPPELGYLPYRAEARRSRTNFSCPAAVPGAADRGEGHPRRHDV
jgi:hypothetical protein